MGMGKEWTRTNQDYTRTPGNQYVRENGHVWGVWEGMEAIITGGWSRAEVVGENLDRGREFGVWE